MEVKGLGAWLRRREQRRQPTLDPVTTFIVGAESQLVHLFLFAPFFSRTITGTRSADFPTPEWGRVKKVIVHITVVVFSRSSDVHELWMRQCFFSGEATRGVGTEEGTDKALGCGIGYQRLEVG